jgi:hypothetical protein
MERTEKENDNGMQPKRERTRKRTTIGQFDKHTGRFLLIPSIHHFPF